MVTRSSGWRAAPGDGMWSRNWRPRGRWASGGSGRDGAVAGSKKRAKTDRADARLLRTLLWEGRFPESWIPPAHVLEVRTLGRLYGTLMDERRAWQQRIHAQLFHQGCPPITALLSEAGRDALVRAELSAAGRQYVDTALRRIDELSAEIEPLRAQLVDFARRQAGCRALQARHYGIGWLCAVIIWAEIGDARRFGSSDQLVRFAGLDVTVYSSDGKRSSGHLSRQGSPKLRWAAFEAAKCGDQRQQPHRVGGLVLALGRVRAGEFGQHRQRVVHQVRHQLLLRVRVVPIDLRFPRFRIIQPGDPRDDLPGAGHQSRHLPHRRHQLGDRALGGHRVVEHRRIHALFRLPHSTRSRRSPHSPPRTPGSGRSDSAIRRRQYTSVDGSKEVSVSARPHATFQRMSYFNASAVCGSDMSLSSLSTSTDPIRSAGCEGRPVAGNRSAINESGNNSPRCSARNAYTLPGGTSSPTIDSASNSSRSTRDRPCMPRSSQPARAEPVRTTTRLASCSEAS